MNRTFKVKTNMVNDVHHVAVKDILSLSLPMFMTATMTFIIGQTGVIMLGIFCSEAEVGYYSVAVKLATLTNFMISAVNSMSAPKFSELFHTEKMDELFCLLDQFAGHGYTSVSFIAIWTLCPEGGISKHNSGAA